VARSNVGGEPCGNEARGGRACVGAKHTEEMHEAVAMHRMWKERDRNQ